ncbi:hypothetical protein [Paenibacillus amylolyticus]|uniref:hypothetical protein n=1 Tax=Paenibacillus amylolyticus TaxID=1451 RepID=UPI00201DF1D6|nr:hypothetical protein [Paenibacillus amylolyticus]MCL6661024.1 hypothetical protein [Paenibacillus amylolyticus]
MFKLDKKLKQVDSYFLALHKDGYDFFIQIDEDGYSDGMFEEYVFGYGALYLLANSVNVDGQIPSPDFGSTRRLKIKPT